MRPSARPASAPAPPCGGASPPDHRNDRTNLPWLDHRARHEAGRGDSPDTRGVWNGRQRKGVRARRFDSRRGGRSRSSTWRFLALVGLLIVIAIAALVAAPSRPADRELAEDDRARRIACTPRHPVPCGRNPLAVGYGFPPGKFVRSLALPARCRAGPRRSPPPPVDSLLPPGELRRPGPEPGLTASGRRVTTPPSVEDRRRAGGGVRVTYWLYRPGLDWDRSCAPPGRLRSLRPRGSG